MVSKSTTAFIVNLPKLTEDATLEQHLLNDGFPKTEPVCAAFLQALVPLKLWDLPEYLPQAHAVPISPDIPTRIQHRVYIIRAINLILPSTQPLPIVVHWQVAEGLPLRAMVITDVIRELPPSPNQQRVGLQAFVSQAPPSVGLTICHMLLLAVPEAIKDKGKGTGKGTGKGKGKGTEGIFRTRTRAWNTFLRLMTDLTTLVTGAGSATGDGPSVSWEVNCLSAVTPEEFATLADTDVCAHWPKPGTWLCLACVAGRPGVKSGSLMVPTTWAAYIAHSIKVTFLSSVWPAMACSSHHVIRGFVTDVETTMFWLAADATNMRDSDGVNSAAVIRQWTRSCTSC